MAPIESNQAVFRRYLEFWRVGDLATIAKLVTADYMGHVSAGDRDAAGLVARIAIFRELYPDIIFIVEDQFAAGEKVVTRMTAHGTHQPTGKATTLIGMNISRVVNGKIAEEWAVWETCADI